MDKHDDEPNVVDVRVTTNGVVRWERRPYHPHRPLPHVESVRERDEGDRIRCQCGAQDTEAVFGDTSREEGDN